MKYIPLIVCLVALYIFFLPLGRSDVVIAGHDAGYHFTRLQLFTAALKEGLASLSPGGRSGQFPVRWIEGPVEGLSHPLFQFYPPFFYYLASFIVLVGIPYVNAIYIGLVIAGAIGWVGMYWFVKRVLEIARLQAPERSDSGQAALSKTPPRNDSINISAMVSAAMFLFTPYRISQIYVRAAYGEFLATSLLPFIFLWILQIFSYRSYKTNTSYMSYMMLLAFSLAAILTSHQPTLLMALPFIAGWVVLLWVYTKNLRGVVFVGLSSLFALLLSSTFLFPLLLEEQFIRASALASNYFDFRIHFATLSQFIYSAWGFGVSQKGPHDGMSFQVGILNWLGLAGLIAAVVYDRIFVKKILSPGFVLVSAFFVCMLTGALFLSLDISLPIWERFRAFSFIQYPWRFLSVGSIATSVLSGLAVSYWLGQVRNHQSRYAVGTLVLLVLFNIKYIAPAAFLPRNTFDLGNPELSQYNTEESPFFGIEMGYMPIFTRELSLQNNKEKALVVAGKAVVTPISVGIVRQSFDIEAKDASTIRILTHYFPGWTIVLDGKEIVPAYNNSEGFMEVTVPQGKHQVTAVLKKTQVRMVADYLSLSTLLVLAGIAIFSLKRFWSKYSGATSPALS
ncbi:MAG: hypothetical protein AAB508_00245 [Patescibacteria group bacterium]